MYKVSQCLHLGFEAERSDSESETESETSDKDDDTHSIARTYHK